jgi:hypothetical protein
VNPTAAQPRSYTALLDFVLSHKAQLYTSKYDYGSTDLPILSGYVVEDPRHLAWMAISRLRLHVARMTFHVALERVVSRLMGAVICVHREIYAHSAQCVVSGPLWVRPHMAIAEGAGSCLRCAN